jgi:RimJ/RimL family protein N-acetyltransferase
VSPGEVPQLRTPRLLLRGWARTDLDPLAEWSADADVMRYVGGTKTREESWNQLAMHIGHWALLGYGTWAVVRQRDDAAIGEIGLWNPEGGPGLEIGWALTRSAWGRGYATEAAHAAVQWAWSALGRVKLIAVIRPENGASIAVARKLGMHEAGTHQRVDTHHLVFSLDPPVGGLHRVV